MEPAFVRASDKAAWTGPFWMHPLVNSCVDSSTVEFRRTVDSYLSTDPSQAPMSESPDQAPLVLIASGGEWVGRSLENVFESNGYTVLRIESGRRALELARRTNPDALLLDDS